MAARDGIHSSWCDKLASVPTAGLHHPPRYVSSSTLLDRLSPLLGDFKGPTVTRQEAFLLMIEDQNGYSLQLSPTKTSVSFQHRIKVSHSSGDANPTVQMLSEPRRYTQLLDEVSKWLMRIVHALDPKSTGLVDRLGIVSATNLADVDCPPGIRSLLTYFGRPWGSSLDKGYAIAMTNPLTKTDKHSDRCIHNLQKSEDDGALITAKFDWQREYSEPKSVRGLDDMLTAGHLAALKYFEDLAEGTNVNAILNN